MEIAYEYPQQLSAPLEKGQQIGEALYTLNGEDLAKYPIRMEESIEKKDYGWCLQQIAARYAVSLFG